MIANGVKLYLLVDGVNHTFPAAGNGRAGPQKVPPGVIFCVGAGGPRGIKRPILFDCG